MISKTRKDCKKKCFCFHDVEIDNDVKSLHVNAQNLGLLFE